MALIVDMHALIDDVYTHGEEPTDTDDFIVRVFRGTVDESILGLELLLYLFEPGCEVDYHALRTWVHYMDIGRFKNVYNELAKKSGLAGGDTNRCFLKFLIRYTDYNMTAYETFVDYLAKYLFEEVSVYGYCLAMTKKDSAVRKDWIKWAEDGLERIIKQIKNALEIFDEPRPTATTSVPTTTLTTALSSEMPYESTPSAPHPDPATEATLTPIGSNLTSALLQEVKDSVLLKDGIDGSMEWDKRADKHQDIADKIYARLHVLNETRYGVSFQVLVSLLQDKEQSDMLCMESNRSRHIKSNKSNGVSYFIQYFDTADLSVGFNSTWKGIQHKNADTVDAVFSSGTQNLCKAAKEEIEKAVNKKVLGLKDGFSGLAVVRCGRQFVWYELGYRYFTVGRTAGPRFTLTSANDGTYNANCGQIFLFP